MVKTGDMIELENGIRGDVVYIGKWHDGRYAIHYKYGLDTQFFIEGDEYFRVVG